MYFKSKLWPPLLSNRRCAAGGHGSSPAFWMLHASNAHTGHCIVFTRNPIISAAQHSEMVF